TADPDVVAVDVEQRGTGLHCPPHRRAGVGRLARCITWSERVLGQEGHGGRTVVTGDNGDSRMHTHACSRKGFSMAAMKPRTGDGPLEVTKEGRGIVMRVPLEGGGRLVVELSPDEATALGDALKSAVG